MSAKTTRQELRSSLRRYEIFGGTVVFLLTVGLFGWSSIAAISSAVIAPGVVAVSGQAKQVQHLEGGIVSEILVKNADQVKAGAALLRLDNTEARASQQIVASQLEEQAALRARLKAELAGAATMPSPQSQSAQPPADKPGWSSLSRLAAKIMQPAQAEMEAAPSAVWMDQSRLLVSRREVYLGKEAQFSDRIGQLDQVVSGLVSQQTSLDQQLTLIRDELKGLELLEAQQLVPKTKIAALRREAARLDGQRGQYMSEIAKTKVQIAETKLQLSEFRQQYQTDLVTELRDVEAKLAEAQEKQTALSARLQRQTVYAPISGVVHKMSAHTVGGVIGAGQTILEIVPQSEALILEGRLEPAAVDKVFVGQPVGVRLLALDQVKTPEVDGEVTSIAPDVRRDDPSSPPYYAVTVKLDDIALADIPGKLVPGMPVELMIRGSDRTVLAYLVKPLTDRIAHTFREN
jgi:HlyD family type I secretion membrane fusion protein